MTHTTLNEIESYLIHGLHVVVKREDGYFKIISPHKGNDGEYRISMWCNTKEKSMETIGALPGYIRSLVSQLAEIESWKIVDTFHTPNKPFKVGQKVEVIAMKEIFTIFERSGFTYVMEEHPGTFAHTELRPLLPEYDVYDRTEEAIQLLRDNGYTITKDNK